MFVDVRRVEMQLCTARFDAAFARMDLSRDRRIPRRSDEAQAAMISELCRTALEQLDTTGQVDGSAVADALQRLGYDEMTTNRCNPAAAGAMDDAARAACAHLTSFTLVASNLASVASVTLYTTLVSAQVFYMFTSVLPVAASLAIGVAQSALLIKHLLPHSRLPAWLATLIVTAGLPGLIALLAIVSQAVAGVGLVLALLFYAFSLAVWAPLGVLPSAVRAVGGTERCVGWARVLASTSGLQEPSDHAEASRLMNQASCRSRAWLGSSLIAVALFIYSAITQGDRWTREVYTTTIISWWESLGDHYGVVTIQMCLAMFARLNLVMLACADVILERTCRIWNEDRADDDETKARREAEYEEALELFTMRARAAPRARVAPGAARMRMTSSPSERLVDRPGQGSSAQGLEVELQAATGAPAHN